MCLLWSHKSRFSSSLFKPLTVFQIPFSAHPYATWNCMSHSKCFCFVSFPPPSPLISYYSFKYDSRVPKQRTKQMVFFASYPTDHVCNKLNLDFPASLQDDSARFPFLCAPTLLGLTLHGLVSLFLHESLICSSMCQAHGNCCTNMSWLINE